MENTFVPHELKTIEVDAEKKIFRINGEDFGMGCTGFCIHCDSHRKFQLRVEVDTTVHFATYGENRQKTSEEEYQTDAPWYAPEGNGLKKNAG